MKLLDQPSPTARQVSARDLQGNPILAVLAKRTYEVDRDGRCRLAEEQLPLVLSAVSDPDNEDLLLHDMDLFPYKPATDVVVKGHGYPHTNQRRFEVAVRVASNEKKIMVIGDRRCTMSATGHIVFSEPIAMEKVPLRYTHAYGGRDEVAETKYGNPYIHLQPYVDQNTCDMSKASPFRYARNPCGKGFLIESSPEALELLQLPNLEDPRDLLTSDRLVVGDPDTWPRMPLPQATDWVDYAWFPRMTFCGFLPEFEPPEKPIAEVERGYAPIDILAEAPIQQKFNIRMTNGASLGLQLAYLKGDETVELINAHPSLPRFNFRLPGQQPRIWTDGRKGTFNKTQPFISTVLIEPDISRLSILWSGSAPALRAYLPQELEKMPLKVEWP